MFSAKKSLVPPEEKVDWLRSTPFILAHLAPLAAIWTGCTWKDFLVCGIRYAIGMFFVTAVYHRYFSHRTYKTSRWFQFVLAFGAQTTTQKGVLWWSKLHRHHHKYSDQPEDVHSPLKGFLWSHMLWILCDKYHNVSGVADPDFNTWELRWLDRWHWVPSVMLGALMLYWGGWGMLLIGFFLSQVGLWHGTFTVNSLSHVWGSQRYDTGDTSRNNFWLALLTFGEGWHNNHHHFQYSVRQGLRWYEIDVTYYGLLLFRQLGLIWDLKFPPPHHI